MLVKNVLGEPYRHAGQRGQDTGEKASSGRVHPPGTGGCRGLVAPILLKGSQTLRCLVVLQDVVFALLNGSREQLFNGIPGREKNCLSRLWWS